MPHRTINTDHIGEFVGWSIFIWFVLVIFSDMSPGKSYIIGAGIALVFVVSKYLQPAEN